MSVHVETKFVDEDVDVVVQSYPSGDTRVTLYDTETGEPVSVVTVDLSAYGYRPAPGNIFVKAYNEGEGNVLGLLDAGIITEVGESFSFGNVVDGAFECVLHPDYV